MIVPWIFRGCASRSKNKLSKMDIPGISVKDGYSLFPLGLGIIPSAECSYDSTIDICVLKLEKFPEEFKDEVKDGQLRLHLGLYDVYKDIIVVPIKCVGNIIVNEGNYIILDTRFESNIKFNNWTILTERVHWTFIK